MPPPRSRSEGRWRRHDHAHHSVLHTALSGNKVPATATANNPTNHRDDAAAAASTRPKPAAPTENTPLTPPPLFRRADVLRSAGRALIYQFQVVVWGVVWHVLLRWACPAMPIWIRPAQDRGGSLLPGAIWPYGSVVSWNIL